MAATAVMTKGDTITLTGAGSEADILLATVVSIGEHSVEADERDTTVLSNSRYKTSAPGLIDPGTFDVTINNVFDGTVETINSIFDAGQVRSWVIAHKGDDLTTTEATTTMDAYLKSKARGEITTEGEHQYTFTLRVTGQPVYTETVV